MLKLIKNKLYLIGFEPTDGTQPSKWEVFKKFKGYDYIHDNELLLVEFKKKFYIKQSKNLTRGDIIFLLVDKLREFDIDEQGLIDGMTFNQKYNDDTQMFDAYVRGVNKDEIDEYKEILDSFGIKYEITKKGIKLVGDRIRGLNEIYSNLVEDGDINYILSFIYGLSIFYGRVQYKELEGKDNYLYLGFQVNFNFKDLWIDIDTLVDELKEKFKNEKLLINVSLNNTNLTFSSNDYEFDKFVGKLTFGEEANVIYGREKHAIEEKERILDFIENGIKGLDNKDEALKIVKENYIKLIG